jgi:hypothetical protein
MAGPKPGTRWDRVWPRVLAVLQAGVGTWVIVHETLGGGERPALLGLAFLAIFGAPATAVAARILSRK